MAKDSTGFKASETLLGIETGFVNCADCPKWRFKASETLLGIETAVNKIQQDAIFASKPLKPF